jgi:hypothetical protein
MYDEPDWRYILPPRKTLLRIAPECAGGLGKDDDEQGGHQRQDDEGDKAHRLALFAGQKP